ncbi:unnamed protein product, partial [Vitis vinifera]
MQPSCRSGRNISNCIGCLSRWNGGIWRAWGSRSPKAVLREPDEEEGLGLVRA